METRCSVVMPYYNNARTLMRSLNSFAAQTPAPYEIVVVDDGSAQPLAKICQHAALHGVPLRLLQAAHGGQSAATNVGVKAARGDIVYLTCPDIVAPKGVLARHLALHNAARARGEEVGVMGHITYAPWLKKTPFLRYLSGSGPQFCYGAITDPNNADAAHLYAPACSIARDRLLAVGGFDEVFSYGFQDTDLGLRLAQNNLRFVYDAQAVVLHDHPNDVHNFARRNERVASLTWHLLDKHPHVLTAETLRQGLRAWGESHAMLPRVRAEIEALERELAGPSAPLRRVTKCSSKEAMGLQVLLDQRYHGLLTFAFSCGLLRGGEQMRQRLAMPQGEWAQLCATLLPHSPTTTANASEVKN